MRDTIATRRTFVGGTVAGAAILGSMAWLSGGDADVAGARFTAPGAQPRANVPAKPLSPEIAAWSAAIGKTVRVAGAAAGTIGVVDMVLNLPVLGIRPAGLRANPFVVYFLVDRAGAPEGNQTYRVTTPIEGLNELFLMRGDDRGGKAVLTAIFN